NTGLLMYPDGICRGRGRGEVDRGQYDTGQAAEVLVPSGCAGVYRRTAMLEHEGFDESFFCYCDDSDLGLACRIAGHRCLYGPTVTPAPRARTPNSRPTSSSATASGWSSRTSRWA